MASRSVVFFAVLERRRMLRYDSPLFCVILFACIPPMLCRLGRFILTLFTRNTGEMVGWLWCVVSGLLWLLSRLGWANIHFSAACTVFPVLRPKTIFWLGYTRRIIQGIILCSVSQIRQLILRLHLHGGLMVHGRSCCFFMPQ